MKRFRYLLVLLSFLLQMQVLAEQYPISLSTQLKNSSALIEATYVKNNIHKQGDHNFVIEYYFNIHSSIALDASEISKNHLFKISHKSSSDPESQLQNHFGEYLKFKPSEKVVLLVKYVDGNYWLTHGMQSRFNLFTHYYDTILISHSFPMHPQLGSFAYEDFMSLAHAAFSMNESQSLLDEVVYDFEEEKSIETMLYEKTYKGRSIASQPPKNVDALNDYGPSTTWLVILLMLMCVIVRFLRIKLE